MTIHRDVLPSSYTTLIDLLRARAVEMPDAQAYVFLKDGVTADRGLTYAELDRQARMIAAFLQERFQPQERVLLMYPPGLDFVRAFWGCLYAGMVAIPIPPPDAFRMKQSLARLVAVGADAQAAGVLTVPETIALCRESTGHGVMGDPGAWIATSGLDAGLAEQWKPSRFRPSDIAYLQYTSGSTSLPKGAIVSHGNLTHHCPCITAAGGYGQDAATLSWMPHYHDYGLVKGVVHPVWIGRPAYLMSAVTFLKRPLRWLQAIQRYRITHSGGPNFAYRYCVSMTTPEERQGLDLSGWQVASCGAEPIFHQTIQEFSAAFVSAGFRAEAFYPAYGMAEYTLLISLKQAGERPAVKVVAAEALEQGLVRSASDERPGRAVVGCGRAVGDTRVEIVDPRTRRRCPPDEVGEIWLAGGSVTQGYWNRQDETVATFHAHLEDSGEGPFLRTGDLGFVENGELYVTGRLKDLIIIRGRNLYPQDLEHTIRQCHPALSAVAGAAFSVMEGETESLAVVQEVGRTSQPLDLEWLTAEIREAVAAHYEVDIGVLALVKAGTVPKTSSGKVQRNACRQLLLSGDLACLFVSRSDLKAATQTCETDSPPDLADVPEEARLPLIESYLARVIGALVGRDDRLIAVEPLNRLGIDSLKAYELIHRIERQWGLSLTLTTVLGGGKLADVAAEVLTQLKTQRAAAGRETAADDAEPNPCQPLSYNQLALWLLHELEPLSPAANVAVLLPVGSDVDPDVLHEVLRELGARHTMLRTTYESGPDGPVQRPHESLPPRWVVTEVGSSSWEDVRARILTAAAEPFDLRLGPLWRIQLFRGDHCSCLLLASHHIAVDGCSMMALVKELRECYRARRDRSAAPSVEPAVSYSEFVAWQRHLLASPAGSRMAEFWRHRLAEPLPHYEELMDRPGAGGEVRRYVSHSFQLSADLTRRLREMAQSQGVTLYGLLVSAFHILLHRSSGQDDVLVGSPFAARGRARFAEMVGNCVNMVILRERITGRLTVRALLERTHRSILEALEHQDYPFALLTERLMTGRRVGPVPPLEVLFALQPFPLLHDADRRLAGGVRLPVAADEIGSEGYVVPQQGGQFPLCLEMSDCSDALSGCFEYDAELFSPETIARMQEHYGRILQGILDGPDRQIGELPLLTEDERRHLLYAFEGERSPARAVSSVRRQFEAQVARQPDAAAIIHEGTVVSYRDLDDRANRLAQYLRGRGVGPEVVVGICLDRSVELIVGVLAVLKAGGAYLPLDPEYPTKRMEQMLADTDIRVLLTETRLLPRLPSDHPHTVCLDSEWAAIGRLPETPLEDEEREHHLAYVLYTSGTTGRPKGVMIERRSLSNYVAAISHHLQLAPGDRVLQFASIGFDAAAEEIFPSLTAGATLVLRTVPMLDSMTHFLDCCRRWEISILDLPTALWHELVARMDTDRLALPPRVRAVIIGGERALYHAVVRWADLVHPEVRLINTYGPTEATIAATIGDLVPMTAADARAQEVSIGRPVPGVQVYVLDANLQIVPVGVTGELYIGGSGLARGYAGRPDLTAERFTHAALDFGLTTRLYRTGDCARWRPDGTLEYRGRVDRQVKIRGYRIELDEIESVLVAHPDLLQAAVEMREDMPGDKRIVAFIVPRPGSTLSVGRLIHDLQQSLPQYMVPSAFVELTALPRNEHGKLDRRALHVERDSRASHFDLTSAYVPPRTATEEMLAQIWGEILHTRDIGVHDNFFELGGNSILATQVVSRVRALLQREVPLRLIFQSPTIANLAGLLSQAPDQEGGSLVPPLSRVPRTGPLPLSFAQERMWFLHQMAPESSAYNIPASVRLQGPLNKTALRASVAQLMRRHESLRTTFAEAAGRPMQTIHPVLEPTWTEHDLRGLPYEARERAALDHATEEARRPFNLVTGPLLRVLLLQLDDEQHVIVLTTHHIIADQWSYGVIARELVDQYNAYVEGVASAVHPDLEVQYADFAQWQRRWLSGAVLEEQLAFWKSRLRDVSPLSLPSDRPRPARHSFKGDHASLDLPWSFVHGLKQVTVREGVTLYMIFLAGFFGLLHRLSGQRDIVIGTPIANRHWLPVESMIGTFVNTLVLRGDVSGDLTFRQILALVRETTLDAYAHQDLPFEKLVETLQPDRAHGGLPIVQVLFNFANTPFARTDFRHLSWTPYEISRGAAQFDLTMSIDPFASRKAYLEFNTDLFDKTTIERWLQHYYTLLEAMVAMPDRPLCRVPLLKQRERHLITVSWNATARRLDDTRSVPRLFEAQAAKNPSRPAVTDARGTRSYGELNQQANRLARYLRQHGVGREVVVAVHLDRSADMLMCLLAIMKAGGAYLPLVPGLPAKRMAVMLETGQAGCIVTTSDLASALPRHQIPVIVLDRVEERVSRESPQDVPISVEPGDLAYVLFTSGSTGVPKGVEIEHRGLTNFLLSMQRDPGMTEQDVLLSVTPLSFDIAGLELYLPLIVGARIVLATGQEAADGHWLRTRLEAGEVTVMQATPATWRLVLQAGWVGTQDFRVLCGGEALSADLAHALSARSSAVWNLYGPTETTIWSTIERVQAIDRTVSLGRPIANTQVYVLDDNLEPVPIGVPGELYIGGAGVARGYRGNPRLTSERFFSNPFLEGTRIYRTGDSVKWLPDGRLEFIGRVDFQVKLRGFRIELGEIEIILGQFPGATQAVVTVHETDGEPQLVAYVGLIDGVRFDAQRLHTFLRERLPDYMIPAAYVHLDTFPLTPNGKIDRRALPAPTELLRGGSKELVAPRDQVELQLVALWEQVLGLSPVGIRDNFFDLGGYSFLALRMFSAIEQIFGKRLPMAVLFQAPTIEHLAHVLREEGCHAPWKSLVAIQTHGRQRPFFVVPGVGGNVLVFARLSKLLGDDQPFYGLQAQGLDGRARPFTRIEEMARHYIQEIRAVQPHGPYKIGGTCTGGLVAYEMAQQLTAAGEQAILVIMESWHPRSYGVHWHRAPYVLWPAIFVAKKLGSYVQRMRDRPMREWAAYTREKLRSVWHMRQDPDDRAEADHMLYRDQVTYATFHAAARYEMKPYGGRVLNIIASQRPLADPAVDTRLAFSESGGEGSRAVLVAAEDSGRLFLPPYVQDVAKHLEHFWRAETVPGGADSSTSPSQAA